MVDYTDRAGLIDLINSEVVKINSLGTGRTLTIRIVDYAAEIKLDKNTVIFSGDLKQVYDKLLEYRTKTEQ